MADLAPHERQNTDYSPQTDHSQNPSDSANADPNVPTFLVQDSDPPSDLPALDTFHRAPRPQEI
jgi:hypothetical protein